MCTARKAAILLASFLAIGGTVNAQGIPVEYSNDQDEEAVAGGGAHGVPDPEQVLFTLPPDAVGGPHPSDIVDYGRPEQVDALANGEDAYFSGVVNNTADLLVSFAGDPGGNAVWFETPAGATGILWTQVDFSNPDPPGNFEDTDGLELWGPLNGSDADFFSEVGDPGPPIGGCSVVTIRPPCGIPPALPLCCFIPRAAIVATVVSLGYTGPTELIELDALMVQRACPFGASFGPGDRIIFSIRDTTGGGASFDGGEIIVLPFGAPAFFLLHGGHLWNTAFNVAGTFGVATEEVDSIEGKRGSSAASRRNMLVLLDRTGSMVEMRSTNNTRCEDALETAMDDVRDFFIANPFGSVSVWTFTGTGPTDLTGGFVNEAAAVAALNTLTPDDCSGATPLAEAICAASDAITAAFPLAAPGDRVLAISSDGGENNSTGQCAGPDSVSGPPYDAGSWQRLVSDKLAAQNVTLVRQWGALARAGLSGDGDAAEFRAGTVSDETFFQDIATSSGGSYVFIDDSNTAIPPVTIGSCCLPDNRCASVSQFMCEGLGGTYGGDGAVCVQGQCVLIMGDIDGDRDVDGDDMSLFVMVLLGIDTGNPAHIPPCDLNEDCSIDGRDIQAFVEARLSF
ncbi:MAG: VWA domain-containing protein [Phycisphaerales bacterium]|nr:VWA domain-containing protein [Phycisphaerales bacterium]